jgi:hypothetical protein
MVEAFLKGPLQGMFRALHRDPPTQVNLDKLREYAAPGGQLSEPKPFTPVGFWAPSPGPDLSLAELNILAALQFALMPYKENPPRVAPDTKYGMPATPTEEQQR